MPLREQADAGVPLVIEDPDDPAAQAIRQVARGLIAMAPAAPAGAAARRGRAPRRAAAGEPETRGHVAADGLSSQALAASATCPSPPPADVAPCGAGPRGAVRPRPRPLDKREPPGRIIFEMPVQDQQEEEEQDDRSTAPEQDGSRTTGGAVEFDERRAKMERLRAEGIDPYPPVSLWATRTRIADVLAAHDPERAASTGEHPRAALPDRRPADLAPRARQDGVPGRARPVRSDPGRSCAWTRSGQETYDRILGLDIGDIVGDRGLRLRDPARAARARRAASARC